MTKRTTRNKIRLQAKSAYEDLKAAQDHMILMSKLIDEAGSEAYNTLELPAFISSTEAVLNAWERFWETL